MSYNTMFVIVSWSTVPAWLLLIVAPQSRATKWIAQYIVPIALAVAYVVLLLTPHPRIGFETLPQLAMSFQTEHILLAGWVHYLVIDLVAGNWEAADAARLGIRRLVAAPFLVLTFLFAPAGWLAYMILRSCYIRSSKPYSGAANQTSLSC